MITDTIKKRREEPREFRRGEQRVAEEGKSEQELQKKAQQLNTIKMRVCSRRALRTSFDLFLYATVAGCLIVTALGILTPPFTVVSCDDPTIRRSYERDTISVVTLLSIGLFLPFFVMTIIEWALPPSDLENNKSPLRLAVSQGWSYTSDLFVGGLFMYFLTDATKVAVGEPRPNFWETCRPNITLEQCHEKYIRVSWRDCTNPLQLSHSNLVDTMKSFPSGHAAVSVFSSIFMIVYIHQRLWRRWSLLAGPWLQLVWAVWTLICCQSRVWDNKHHWWDVLGGIFFGAFGAIVTLHYLSNWFDRSKNEDLSGRCGESSLERFTRQDDHLTSRSFARNSIKRLISNTSDTDSTMDQRSVPDTRELRDIHNAMP
ncbi:hypothetical protein Pcinc_014351 [Petrolisthes cinctipes]|uniref:Phosphatidic acid phosphatase type 2/haloperoxidase domain-containing protein n=1 Tax=Petrolisthes cinctipes TaxID=88211 RepID=A0AAE1KRG5_PETCI|nr:hypothetical protein Pcinc_014351 [Petrolisthes cinctipes]